jgi:S-adenosylmethionine decarboxylase
VCNFGADNSARARQLLAALVEAFAPRHVEHHALQRGTR